MKAAVAWALAMLLAAGPAAAIAPSEAPRPDTRPDSGALAIPQGQGAIALSPRPEDRPPNLKRKVTARATGYIPVEPRRDLVSRGGRLCGVPGIEGERIAPIPARIAGCGLPQGVLVRSVDGVRLSRPARIDCPTARSLHAWVVQAVKPIVGRRGGGVEELRVAAHYSCRTRNNRPGARVSEHGKGRAIDIAGVTLRNGVQLNVLTGWNDPAQGPLLQAMHRAACGPFGTVLGPKSDRHHRDHFHFDTARHRSGPYCR